VWTSWPAQLAAVIAGGALVTSVLRRFATARSIQVAA
jgi:hypothetical protein